MRTERKEAVFLNRRRARRSGTDSGPIRKKQRSVREDPVGKTAGALSREAERNGNDMKFVRERIVSQGGRYKDADLVHYTTEQTKRLARTERKRLTPEKIRRQNEKNRERYLRQLLNTNFTDEDFRVDLTYTDRELPGSRAEAKRDLRDYLERLRRLFRKRGAVLRYVRVTGGGREKERGEGLTRLHHHVIVGGADGRITREEIEDLWKKGRGETRRLRAEEDGYTGLMTLMAYCL